MEKYDFIIQIIGLPQSGKSTIAHMIEEILDDNRVNISSNDLARRSDDFRDVRGKTVYISILNTECKEEIARIHEIYKHRKEDEL